MEIECPSEHKIDILSRDKIEPSLGLEKCCITAKKKKKCCIYQVPEKLRKDKEAFYTPQLISIGPIHRQNPKPLNEEKNRYYKRFKKRLGATQELKIFEEFLSKNEKDIRNFYWEEYPDICGKDFIEMMQLDAVFIMELFLHNSEIKKKEVTEEKIDYLFTILWLYAGIKQDLLLLENQLPFFVLVGLQGQLVNGFSEDSLLSLINNYFGFHNENISDKNISDFKHFTDFTRYYYIPWSLTESSSPTDKNGDQRYKNGGQCATEDAKKPLLNKNGGQRATKGLMGKLLDKIVGQTKKTKPIPNWNHRNDARVSATKLKAAGVSFEMVDKYWRLVSVHLCISLLNL